MADFGGHGTSVLRKVKLTILETEECRKFADYPKDFITDNMICTYGNTNDGERKDMCDGDSGGELN